MDENKLPILPTFQDFEIGGALEGIKIPDMGPIPKEVVKFMFGDENYPMTKAYTFKILTYLHELFLWDIQYCDCLEHILYKKILTPAPIASKNPEIYEAPIASKNPEIYEAPF
jgi:hypothetical protein